MKNYLLVFLMVVFSGTSLFAQERTVSGKVTDAETGEPVPGVNILIQGTTSGTVSDINGDYQVEVPSGAVTLVFSYVGYKTIALEVGASQSSLDMALEPDVTALSEVVVIGYGTQEKKEITSSVASVKSENFNQGNVNNAAGLIAGKVAGLSISKPGGNPNAGYNIRLRGLSTIGQNTSPLIVIDGIIGASLDNVDPNDIESIDVLKDGSAAAIYGSRGSSGVILVTTRSGKEGKFEVDYNGYLSLDQPYNFVEVFDGDGWREFRQELADAGRGTLGTDFGESTDWFDEITQTAVTQVHTLSLSGGSSKTTYRASINFRDGDGVALNTGFKQLNSRLNLSQKALNDKLTLTFNLFGTFREAQYGFDEAFRYATIYNPTAPVKSDPSDPLHGTYDGYFQQILFDYYNPVSILELNKNNGRDTRVNMALRGSYEIIEGLNVDAFYSLQHESFLRGRYYDKNSYWVGADRNGRAEREYDENQSQLFETTVNWLGDFGMANVNVLGGYSYQEFNYEGFDATAGDFISDALTYNSLQSSLEIGKGLASMNSYKNQAKLVAFFGRVNVNVDETYFLSASLRYEGSTRFGEDNKWGLFPAVSGGVELANFIGSAAIDNLKFRVSYGVTGNIPRDPYLSLLRLGRSGNFFYNGEFVPGYAPVSNANPDLKWEKKGELNIGFDYSFLGSKLFGAIDFYTRTTTDLIINIQVPSPPNLYNTSWLNIGEIKNSGIELALSYNAVSKPTINYTPTLTFNYYLSNELVSLSNDELEYGVRDLGDMGSPGQNGTPLVRIEEGKPIGQLWGLQYESIGEDGNWIFADVNGDGIKSGGNEDRTVIGNGLPDWEAGLNNTFTFGKNWDLNFFFRGSFGHDLINSYRGFYEVPNVITSYNVLESSRDVKSPGGVYLSTSQGKVSSYHVEDASFVKLDNINLGYTFNLPANSSFRKIRLYLAGNNLFVITGYKGVDPEVRWVDTEFGADLQSLLPGIERRNTWFLTRSYLLGVNLQF